MQPSLEDSSFEGLMFARKLAAFCPTSLSMDDLNEIAEKTSSRRKWRKERSFIPPSSSMTVITEETTSRKAPKKSSSVFSFMLTDVKEEKETKKSLKMRYELPNITKLHTTGKTNRPLLIVELSAKVVESTTVSSCASDNELFE